MLSQKKELNQRTKNLLEKEKKVEADTENSASAEKGRKVTPNNKFRRNGANNAKNENK
ncbi:MAG: hypothetical protein CM1200mP16_01350 [Nitrospina sp.]|nr:MAG: hypothetical protein CM1200mP16_01350 [Nitrospina sp.]